jgi:ribosome-associated protein
MRCCGDVPEIAMKPEDLISRNFASECVFSASRSSGPGGQNVNKVNTRIELRFNIETSLLLTEEEKKMILERLKEKITRNGDIIFVSQTERTQPGNKRKVLEKFHIVLAKALTPKKKRIPTSAGKAAKAKRLEEKRKRSEIKKSRGGSARYTEV